MTPEEERLQHNRASELALQQLTAAINHLEETIKRHQVLDQSYRVRVNLENASSYAPLSLGYLYLAGGPQTPQLNLLWPIDRASYAENVLRCIS